MLAQRLVPQSSKLITRVRFPYTARYDSMPVGSSRRGSHDHAGRVRWFTPPFVRRTREYRQRPSSYGWMMRTALCRKGWCESDKAYPPSAGKVSWNAGDCVSCQPTHRMWERSRGAWGSAPVIPVMPRVAVCASTASMSAGFGTSGRIHSGLRGHIPADCLRMLS